MEQKLTHILYDGRTRRLVGYEDMGVRGQEARPEEPSKTIADFGDSLNLDVERLSIIFPESLTNAVESSRDLRIHVRYFKERIWLPIVLWYPLFFLSAFKLVPSVIRIVQL